MNKKTFALNAIIKYFKDNSLCGFQNSNCTYLTNDNKMCVVGQFMIDPSNYKWEGASIDHILEQNLQDDVFKPEAVGILNIGEWRILQRIHDIIAVNEKRNFTSVLKKDIEFLDIFTFDELVEFSQN